MSGSRSSCAIPVPASRRRSSRTCSISPYRIANRSIGRAAGSVSDSRSSRTSSRRTAARSWRAVPASGSVASSRSRSQRRAERSSRCRPSQRPTSHTPARGFSSSTTTKMPRSYSPRHSMNPATSRGSRTTRCTHSMRIASSFPQRRSSDIGLPVIDGYELARRIRALPGGADVHLIAVTGYGQASDRERAASAGFDRHLVKPVSLATIRGLLDTALRPSSGIPAAQ